MDFAAAWRRCSAQLPVKCTTSAVQRLQLYRGWRLGALLQTPRMWWVAAAPPVAGLLLMVMCHGRILVGIHVAP
jgi:hypothetical protein